MELHEFIRAAGEDGKQIVIEVGASSQLIPEEFATKQPYEYKTNLVLQIHLYLEMQLLIKDCR